MQATASSHGGRPQIAAKRLQDQRVIYLTANHLVKSLNSRLCNQLGRAFCNKSTLKNTLMTEFQPENWA